MRWPGAVLAMEAVPSEQALRKLVEAQRQGPVGVCGAGTEPGEGSGTQRAQPGRGGARQGQEPSPPGGGESTAVAKKGPGPLLTAPTREQGLRWATLGLSPSSAEGDGVGGGRTGAPGVQAVGKTQSRTLVPLAPRPALHRATVTQP